MSSMNSRNLGSSFIICSASYVGSNFSRSCCLANFFASLAPIHRSSSSGSAFFAAFFVSTSLFAELPWEYLDHGRGICALCTLRAYCTSIRLVSINVLSKYFNAPVAIVSVLNPTNAICLDTPSVVRTIFTSVTSPCDAKCSRNRASFTCLGTFFTHNRLDGDGSPSPSPSCIAGDGSGGGGTDVVVITRATRIAFSRASTNDDDAPPPPRGARLGTKATLEHTCDTLVACTPYVRSPTDRPLERNRARRASMRSLSHARAPLGTCATRDDDAMKTMRDDACVRCGQSMRTREAGRRAQRSRGRRMGGWMP